MSRMFSKRGAELRVINGYKFRLHKLLADDIQRWVCTKKSCKAYMKIDESGDTAESNLEHNHSRDCASMLMRQKVANACKRKASDDIFERPSKIMRKEMTSAALEVLTESDRQQIRKSIHNARARLRPKLPKTLPELHEALEVYETKTKLEEEFLLVNDNMENILMFSTAKNLKFLSTCEDLLMDGTFYAVPTLFAQLFVIFGRKKYTHVPLVYFLLTSKEKETYKLAFQKLKSFLSTQYTPRLICVDYEDSIHTALRQVWPSATLQGCRFHLHQSWFRRLANLGLKKVYGSKSAEGSYLRSFFGLAFLSPDEVEDFFVNDFTQGEPDDEQVQRFSDYVYSTYISSSARFPPSLWSKYAATIARTTNACESFNSHLNGMFYHGHPNVFLLIDGLLEIQESAYTKMLSVDSSKQRKRSALREVFIREIMDELEGGVIDKGQFVKKLSRKFLPAV